MDTSNSQAATQLQDQLLPEEVKAWLKPFPLDRSQGPGGNVKVNLLLYLPGGML